MISYFYFTSTAPPSDLYNDTFNLNPPFTLSLSHSTNFKSILSLTKWKHISCFYVSPFFSFLIFTISKLNFKLLISPNIYVHRKRLDQMAESSSIDPKACHPSYWSKRPAADLPRFPILLRPKHAGVMFFSRRVVRARALLLRRTYELCSPLVV